MSNKKKEVLKKHEEEVSATKFLMISRIFTIDVLN